MMVLLRHMYGFPYSRVINQHFHLLQHHASAFVLAEKYQYHGLQADACGIMKGIVDADDDSLNDLLQAIRVVLASSIQEGSMAENCLVAACIVHLRSLLHSAEFFQLLQELSALGPKIFQHRDFEAALLGAGK